MTKEILNKETKDITFEDLIHLQKELDKLILEPRENGFVPRTRTGLDKILALDDEFNEWLKELPYELNFKIWKQQKYNKNKELEEFTDILFFILAFVILSEDCMPRLSYQKMFKNFNKFKSTKYEPYKNVDVLIKEFKYFMWNDYVSVLVSF